MNLEVSRTAVFVNFEDFTKMYFQVKLITNDFCVIDDESSIENAHQITWFLCRRQHRDFCYKYFGHIAKFVTRVFFRTFMTYLISASFRCDLVIIISKNVFQICLAREIYENEIVACFLSLNERSFLT